MDLTPAQAYILAALPATDAELYVDCRTASANKLCEGLPHEVTGSDLALMMADLEKLGHCERRADGWFRTTPKVTEPKQKELF
jgi:hypothetical protein